MEGVGAAASSAARSAQQSRLALTSGAVRIYWYRPYHQYPESRLAREVLLPGDRLTIHSLSSHLGEELSGSPAHYEAVRELPDVRTVASGSHRWLLSRMVTYTKRARLRQKLVDSRQYDICHIFALNYFTDAWALRHLARRQPLVSTVHDVTPHQSRLPRGLERRLLGRMYSRAGTLVVAHDVLRKALMSEFDISPERIEVIPLPTSEVIDISDPEPAGPPTVLFFGHFRPNKGVEPLLAAIRLIEEPNVRFLFAGRGETTIENEVLKAAEEDSRIIAEIGYVDDEMLGPLFGRAHLTVLPYTSFASQSGVLGDAYSHLVPLVATDVGALGETVRNEGSGWVVAPREVEMLAETLSSALSDEEGRRMAREAMFRARAQRTPEAVGRAHRQLYSRLVG